MRNHPWTFGREGFRSVSMVQGFRGFLAGRSAAGTPWSMAGTTRAIGAAFICFMRLTGPARHYRNAWGCHQYAWRGRVAVRASAGGGKMCECGKCCEGTAVFALVVIEGHGNLRTNGGRRPRSRPPDSHRSCAIGISTDPSRYFVGPSAFGIISHSKMSLGSQSVAQALGISTTPEICPCTGAVPKIE